MGTILAALVAGLAGTTLLVGVLGLGLSIPVLAVLGFNVLWRREGVPISYNVRSMARRKLTSMATLVGLALVVFVTTAALMLASGIESTLVSTGLPLNTKVLPQGMPTEGAGWIDDNQVRKIAEGPELAVDAGGQPLVSAELVLLTWAQRSGSSDPDKGSNLTLRGVRPVAFDVHPPRALAGRRFTPGSRELVIGSALVGRFEGAQLGGTMRFAERDWRVVGVSDHAGSAHDSELWGDYDALSTTFRRSQTSLTARLKNPDALLALSARLASDPELSGLEALRESTFWRSRSGKYVSFVKVLGGVVGSIFALGAVLGAMNTMYAQVSARTRELATLRAIGFKRRAVLTSVLLESALFGLSAGVVGVAGAGLLQMVEFRLTTDQTLAEITYSFHLSPGIALVGLGFAVVMGYAGGLLPAIAAARMPLIDAIRAD
jgi:ABC-type lipoprotein release transport system permease subunit